MGNQDRPRRALLRAFWNAHGTLPVQEWPAFTEAAFALPQREAYYAALDYPQTRGREWTPELLPAFELALRHNPWWDTVDVAAAKLIGPLLLRYPAIRDAAVTRWMASRQLWMARTAIIFQLGPGPKTDERLLFDVIRQLSGHQDFFIRKAIGWALRQRARRRTGGGHPICGGKSALDVKQAGGPSTPMIGEEKYSV